MVLMRCPECGKITFNMEGSCRHCGAALSEENAPPEIMAGLISVLFGALILWLCIELDSVPLLCGAAAFVLIGLYSIFSHKKKIPAKLK